MFIKANLGAITYKLTTPINIQRGSLLALFHMVSHSLLTACLRPQKCYLASMPGASRLKKKGVLGRLHGLLEQYTWLCHMGTWSISH